MTDILDLDAYFERIRWTGGTSLTLETLTGLLHAHTGSIPFENLDVLLLRPVRLDLASIQNKLIRDRRGGYCFEHATLFAAVLEAIGFRPSRHASRVVLFQPRTEVPRGHMFLTVPVDCARFVVDPGFGPFGARFPVRLVDSGNGPGGPDTHWMARDDGQWALYVPHDGAVSPGWVTTLEEENVADFEVANHFTATHPESIFLRLLMLSAATPDGRINVINRDVTILEGTEPRRRQLADRAELRALLAAHFGFDLPEVEGLVVPTIPEWR